VNAVTGSASSTDTSLQQSLVDSSTIGNIINSLQSMGSSALKIALRHPVGSGGGTVVQITPDTALDQLSANKSMASKIIDNFTATGATLQSLNLSHDASGNISISTPQAPVYNHTDIVIPPLNTATIPTTTNSTSPPASGGAGGWYDAVTGFLINALPGNAVITTDPHSIIPPGETQAPTSFFENDTTHQYAYALK
jgi:hypothetical protein